MIESAAAKRNLVTAGMLAGPLKSGWVVVADIVGYSLKSDPVQRDIATFLMRAVESTYLFRHYLQNHAAYSISCTGDGFILVVDDGAIDGSESELLAFVEQIQALVAAYEQRLNLASGTSEFDRAFKIRMGLHRGAFSFEEIRGQRNSIGTGLNVAVRIAGHGDAGHILASREFADTIKRRSTLGEGQFLGPCGEARVKHGLGLPVYTYFRQQSPDGAVLFGRKENSKAGERQIQVDILIERSLKGLIDQLSGDLSRIAPAGALGLRATILAPTPSLRHLAVTEHRYVYGEPPGATDAAFLINPVEKPQGASAKAYTTDEVQFVLGLPDRYLDYSGYCRELADVGLDEAAVAAFRRPCRAFIAVPFHLPVTSDTRFVLTVDSLHPLRSERYPDTDVVEIAKSGVNRTLEALGLLLELKQPLTRERKEHAP